MSDEYIQKRIELISDCERTIELLKTSPDIMIKSSEAYIQINDCYPFVVQFHQEAIKYYENMVATFKQGIETHKKEQEIFIKYNITQN